MSKQKYDNFTLSLALFDALPVIFFSAGILLIATKFTNPGFVIGAFLCSAAGCLKVLWKIILAGCKKDISILNRQLRFLMPVGFLLLIVGIISGRKNSALLSILQSALQFPSILFFIITLIGMVFMSIFAFKLDGTKARSNWIEQITNTIAQGCFLLGIIFCL